MDAYVAVDWIALVGYIGRLVARILRSSYVTRTDFTVALPSFTRFCLFCLRLVYVYGWLPVTRLDYAFGCHVVMYVDLPRLLRCVYYAFYLLLRTHVLRLIVRFTVTRLHTVTLILRFAFAVDYALRAVALVCVYVVYVLHVVDC